jgi:hypothetical protein
MPPDHSVDRSRGAIGVIRQRTPSDCGAAALAMYLVDAAMRHADPQMRGLNGTYNRDILAAARAIGVSLAPTRRFDLDEDEGVLRVRWEDRDRRRNNPDGHFVTVVAGCIRCPDEQVSMPWREYIAKFGARPCTLLKGTL